MKYFILFFSLCLFAPLNAQITAAVIKLPEAQVLYRGFDNEISVQIVNLQYKHVSVFAKNASLEHIEADKYIVRPGKGMNALVGVNCIDGDSTYFIGQQYFKVLNLPDPILYFGGKKESTYVAGEINTLTAAYPKEIPINASFEIRSWTLFSGNQKISGTGGEITGAEELLGSMEGGKPVSIRATVLGPDGILRRITGCWFVN